MSPSAFVPAPAAKAPAQPEATARLDHAMSLEEYRLLRRLINEQTGLTFEDDAGYLLEKRLAPRVHQRGLPHFSAYCELLRADAGRGAEMEAVVDALTPHETYLFREPHQFRAFADELLPAVAESNARQRRIAIWSAGCSTGEEVYTIAVLVAKSGLFHGWDVDVFGSDMVRRVLSTARAGVYGPRAFRIPEAEALRPWFREQRGRWRVQEDVRQMVRFGHLNLVDPRTASRVGPVDVVFCRNVLIYLDLASRRRVLGTFRDKLHEGGFLLLGHSESMRDLSDDFELVQLQTGIAYRKPRSPS